MATYADEGQGIIVLGFIELEPRYRAANSYHRASDLRGLRNLYAHMYLGIGKFPDAPRFGQPTYQRDSPHRLQIYAE